MPILPLVDLLILTGSGSLLIGFILKAVAVATRYNPAILGFSSVDFVPMGLRIMNALNSFFVYIAQAVVPIRMAVFYPLRPIPVWGLALAALFLVGMTLLVVRRARSAGYLVTGWF